MLKNRGRKVRGKESDFLYAAEQPETCSQQHASTSVFQRVEPSVSIGPVALWLFHLSHEHFRLQVFLELIIMP